MNVKKSDGPLSSRIDARSAPPQLSPREKYRGKAKGLAKAIRAAFSSSEGEKSHYFWSLD
jgi:hypothetical protein